VVADALKHPKKPPPARVWLDAREMVVAEVLKQPEKNLLLAFGREGGGGGRGVETAEKNHLRLAFGHEGGGGGGRRGTTKKNHLRLAFGCEGGDDGGRGVETTKKNYLCPCLDAREVVVVAGQYVWSSWIRIALVGLDSPALVPRLSLSSLLL
jgi:hypothetical protein